MDLSVKFTLGNSIKEYNVKVATIMSTKKPGISLILVWVAGMLIHSSVFASTCLYVSSYHKGYEWSDGIEQGIATVLKGKCKLDKFYMDTELPSIC